MSKYKFWLLILIIYSSCNNKEDKIFPEIRDLHEFVYSSVTVQPDSSYQVYSAVGGILEENLLEEGDLVKKGTPVLQIIATSPDLNSQNARLSYELAQKNYTGNATVLDAIVKEVDAAKLKVENDSINYFRLNRLWENKIGTKAQLDASQLAFQLSSNNLEVLHNKYDRTKTDLEIQMSQAKNIYKNSVVTQKEFTVKSAINGKVYALYKKKGEIINTMEPVASLGSANNFILEMLVDEVDIVRVKIGQSVFLNLDSYPQKIFEAKISKIYPKKDERSQTFKVEAVFTKEPDVLYPGLSGEANIEINSKNEALVIPKKYLNAKNQVKTDDGFVRIETGLQTLDSIEILSGINSKTGIYILP